MRTDTGRMIPKRSEYIKINPDVLDWGIEYLMTRLHDCTVKIPEYETDKLYNAVAATILVTSRWRFNQVSGKRYSAWGRKLEAFYGIYARMAMAAELAKKKGLRPPDDYTNGLLKPSGVSSSQYSRMVDDNGWGLLPIDAHFDFSCVLEGLDEAVPELIPMKYNKARLKEDILDRVDKVDRADKTDSNKSTEEVFDSDVNDLWKALTK